MAENTKIEWADHTFNPWEGCTKVGPGCDHCYAEARNNRFKGGNWGPGAPRRRTSKANWAKPIKWNREAEAKGIRYRVFCASLADVFDNEVPQEWRRDLFRLIALTPNLDWLLLTKRIGNVTKMVSDIADHGRLASHEGDLLAHQWRRVSPPLNVWLGATIVNQQEAERDILKLLEAPAAVRFLSMEPLLGPVDFSIPFSGAKVNVLNGARPAVPPIDWVIVGGESGSGARPMDPQWARSIRDQCNDAGVPFLFKQWGEHAPNWFNDNDGKKIPDSEWIDRMGKKIAGRELDGRTWDEIPGAQKELG